jgi:hypothetical protein
LDFHPYTQVTPKICTSLRLRASTPVSRRFALPRHRSAGFGYPDVDSWRVHHAPRKLRAIGFPTAPGVDPLALPTPRTPWPNFQIGRTDAAPRFWRIVAFTPVQSVTRWFHVFAPPVRGTFQLSLTLLLCYRFLGVFRVRGSCPRYSGGISNPPYSLLRHHPRLTATGLSPSTVPRSRGLHIPTVGWTRAPHLHALSRTDSACPVPSSIAFTNGISIDFFSSAY